MTNTPPTAPEPRELEEARPIDDTSMVFRSKRGSMPAHKDKKSAIKATRGKLIARKSTPAPIFKRNGRKRLVDSPLPEDKQVWKKIEFGEATSDGPDAPKCKTELFPATSRNEREIPQPGRCEEAPLENENLRMAMVCYAAPGSHAEPMTADQNADAEEVMDHHDKGGSSIRSWSLSAEEGKSNGTLAGERDNIPELVVGTNQLLESPLDPCQVGDSRDLLAVGASLQPKKDNILLLASLDSADMLDVAAAQPLLAGGMPEKVPSPRRHETEVLPADNLSVLLIGAPPVGLSGSKGEMGAKASQVVEGPWGALGQGGPIPVVPGAGGTYVAPLDEFPPLGKGQVTKIRHRFEDGSRPRVEGSRGSGPGVRGQEVGSGQPDSSGGVAFAVGSSSDPSAGMLGIGLPQGSGSAGYAEAITHQVETHAEISDAARTGLQGVLGTGNALGAFGPRQGFSTNQGGHMNGPKSMADLLRDRPDPNRPQVFVPEKITNMGFVSTSKGLPSIYFSGAEIQRLADNIGYAIVGKFSHSIPNSKQIQKSLENIKFQRGFSWKYINAKHILVQFEDLADYARLLSGPKGTPVWYVDRHPMRVFKWTPDFDAYCESPIAAIWCNLIGLPIHLFDQSALFAIGKLLGTPIQVDRATADRSRLSFARICIEIDITKPPPEEIILDICGREIVQKVRWGKIPEFCQECKHVGHSSEVCYAAGKMERPQRRNYHSATPEQNHQDVHAAKENQDQSPQPQKENAKERQWTGQGKGSAKGDVSAGVEGSSSGAYMEMDNPPSGWVGLDIMGGSCDSDIGVNPECVGRDVGADPEGVGNGMELDQGLEFREVGLANHARSRSYGGRGTISGGRGCARGSGRFSAVGGRGATGGQGPAASANFLSTNQFYTLMGNGEYDVDGSCEDDPTGMGG